MFGHFDNSTILCLVLEYCPGVTLRCHCIGKRLPEREVAKYVFDVSSALQYCHSRRVIHRDIKTENLMLEAPNGTVKLIHFGFAVIEGDEPQRTLCGTPEYLAPEIFSPDGYNKKVDSWAVGVLVYKLLVGSEPFSGTLLEIRARVMEQNIEWPVGIDHHAQELITSLLHMDPEEQLSFDSVLVHPFLWTVDGSP